MDAALAEPIATDREFRLERTVSSTPQGVRDAGAAVVNALTEWGLATYAERGERVATVLTSWLARHDHYLGKIYLFARYDPALRELYVAARDGGSMLPVCGHGDMLRAALAEAGDLISGAQYITGGRMLWSTLGPLLPWTVRCTWSVKRGADHAYQTYERCESRQLAEQAAAAVPAEPERGVRLLDAEIKGPGDEWTSVYRRASTAPRT
jgi:hypothetical protein